MVRIKSTPVKSLEKQITTNDDPKYTIYIAPIPIARKNNVVDVAFVHPLVAEGRLSRDSLTLLQGALTDIIGRSNQETAHIDNIYPAISKIWSSIRNRDSLPSNDLKKAVQLSLKTRINNMPLFKADVDNPRLWSLCTIHDIESVQSSNFAKLHAETINELNSPESVEGDAESDGSDIGRDQEIVVDDINSLTDLQRLISEVIIIDGGSSHFNSIHEYVLKNWTKMKGKDGQPKTNDCRRAILASLSKNLYTHPLFMRDSKLESHWKMALYNPLKNYTSLPDIPVLENKNGLDLGALTDLQKLIISAIGSYQDQRCDFELINEYVSQRWDQLRRRDGSHYAANIKRAIQASLSNNSASQPIFQKESKELPGVKGIWSLSPRGMEFYALLEKRETVRSPIRSLNASIESDHAIKDESDAINSDWSGDSHHMDNKHHMSDDDEDVSREVQDENEAISILGRKRSRENSANEESNEYEPRRKQLRTQYMTRIENILSIDV